MAKEKFTMHERVILYKIHFVYVQNSFFTGNGKSIMTAKKKGFETGEKGKREGGEVSSKGKRDRERGKVGKKR